MIEDKLSADERIRLEALAQAISRNQMKQTSPEMIIAEARDYEKFIVGSVEG